MDVVVHLAAISNDPMGNQFEDVTLEINHRAGLAIAQAARKARVKSLVFASSCSVYGFAADGARTEGSSLDPLTAYARSKVLLERDLEPLSGPDFRVTCLRFATACGWSERLRLDLVLNDFVAGALASHKVTVLSDGTPWRPLIHVSDMARAIEWACNPVRPGGGLPGGQRRQRRLELPGPRPGQCSGFRRRGDRGFLQHFGATGSQKLSGRLCKVPCPRPGHQPQVGLAEAIQGLRTGLESMGFRTPRFASPNACASRP